MFKKTQKNVLIFHTWTVLYIGVDSVTVLDDKYLYNYAIDTNIIWQSRAMSKTSIS